MGSACTLVAEAFLAHRRAAASGRAEGSSSTCTDTLSREVATLLAGVILIDTMNMSPEAAKGTARDEAALTELLPLVATPRLDLYKTLMDAKVPLFSLFFGV